MVYWLLWIMFGGLVRRVWIREVRGLENLPRSGPAIVAANHCSYLDFFILPAVTHRRIHFLAAEKFYRHPLWRALMWLTRQIRVERGSPWQRPVYLQVKHVLGRGGMLCVFPEGTRSRDGAVHRGLPGAIQFAAHFNVPLVPVGIEGTFRILPPGRSVPLLRRVCAVRIGAPVMSGAGCGDRPWTREQCERMLHDVLMPTIASLAGAAYLPG